MNEELYDNFDPIVEMNNRVDSYKFYQDLSEDKKKIVENELVNRMKSLYGEDVSKYPAFGGPAMLGHIAQSLFGKKLLND